MSKKMVSCRTCGADIAKSAKVCPSCGAKNKKPIYKRWWLWALVVMLVLGMFGNSGDGEQVEASAPSASEQTKQPDPAPVAPAEPEPEIEYQVFTVKQLVEDLRANALKAEQTYQGQYVELTGELQVIDSDGRYISLIPNGEFTIDGVQCFIKGDVQKAAVLEMKVGDTVTVRGKITDIGEILGYQLNVAEFVME